LLNDNLNIIESNQLKINLNINFNLKNNL